MKLPKLSYFIAILAWLNTFALMWILLFYPPYDRVMATLTLILFAGVALVASSMQAQASALIVNRKPTERE